VRIAREFTKAAQFEREVASIRLPMAYALRAMTAMQLGQPDVALAAARKAVLYLMSRRSLPRRAPALGEA
jgi:hypothetical protein